ncbi:hypothetical protein AAL_06572 [Moelleriella libera RCEF 2490]|uniref:Uncharacterized protein n=1 Tax=Moelleriella libera RCEF 2490 TaxID=1081109 RepID=A0A167YVR6_9HYPO|nr:hypothetical protein AAL_06572 [Moelleriella libera RCEF 2490]
MPGVVAVATSFITGAKLFIKVRDTLRELVPKPPTELEKYHRSFQCTMHNATQFQIVTTDNYICSGKFFETPKSVDGFKTMSFSGSNEDHNPAGVTLGSSFRLSLDSTHFFDFSVGLTAPLAGSYKAGVVESADPKAGYEAALRKGVAIISENTYISRDEDGNKQEIMFHVAAFPGKYMSIEIRQIIV